MPHFPNRPPIYGSDPFLPCVYFLTLRIIVILTYGSSGIIEDFSCHVALF